MRSGTPFSSLRSELRVQDAARIERERDRDKSIDRKREKGRETERDRERGRERESERNRERERERGKEKRRERERESNVYWVMTSIDKMRRDASRNLPWVSPRTCHHTPAV